MRLWLSIVGVLLFTFAALAMMKQFRPEAKKEERVEMTPAVEIFTVTAATAELRINSQAVVESRREVTLSAEVAGKIIEVSSQWKRGGMVKKNDLLVKLDKADFTAARARAESAYAQAMEQLEMEMVQAALSLEEWKRVSSAEPSALTKRDPQVNRAKALVVSTQADVEKAKRDEERTEIRAPFDGRVRSTSIEEGAYVVAGQALGMMYADQDLELRVPVSLHDYAFVATEGEVKLEGKIGNDRILWSGKITRFDGEIERSTNSGYILVSVEASAQVFPPVGLFVEVSLPAKPLQDVMKIPRTAVAEEQRVILVNAQDQLEFRTIEIIRAETQDLFVRGLKPDDRLCVTRMQVALPGMAVRVAEPLR
jgi:RND family efflux transporter MFP subunit